MVLLIRIVLFFNLTACFAQTAGSLWQYVGPKSNHYQYKGLFMSVWADETNLNHVMTGSSCGGLFYTKNALSENTSWKNITDNLPYMNFGVTGIVVKKNTDNQTIFISTHTGGGLLKQGFGNGILVTHDGGKQWNQIGPKGKTDYDFPLHGLVCNQQNQEEMAAFNHTELFLTRNSWRNFETIALPFHKDVAGLEITEVEYAPNEIGKIYVSTRTYNQNKAQLFVTNDFGVTWKDITPKDVVCERIAIATLQDPKHKGKFYIAVGNTDIFIRYFNGKAFSAPLNATAPITHLGAASFWCLELKVNQVDTAIIYLSLTETSMSYDGGKTFKKIGYYNGVNTHADVRDMILVKSTRNANDDKLFLANDGGISLNNNLNSGSSVLFRNLNGPGLEANMFWGIDVLQSDSLFIAGGAQDNGGFFIKQNRETNNLSICGDGYFGLVLDDSMAMVLGNPPIFILHNANRNSNAYIQIADGNFEARRPLMLVDSFVYIAYHDIWRAKKKDIIHGKLTFTNVSNLPKIEDATVGIKNREIKALAISKNNTALFGYTNPLWGKAKNEGKLFYCKNILAKTPEIIDVSQLAIVGNMELCHWWQIESIAADEVNENTFYIIYRDVFNQENADIYKFVYYPDSNKASIKTINYNLKRIGFNRIKMDNATQALYLAANDGVYVLNLAKQDTVWKSLNFYPKVLVSDVVFNTYTNKLYAATFGRGIWESAIPSLNSNTIRVAKNKTAIEPLKIDGNLIVKRKKVLRIKSKLILTKGSKIVLEKGAKLIFENKSKSVDENNEPINILPFVEKNKKAEVLFLN